MAAQDTNADYFATHYADIRWPLESAGAPGLRVSQAGAMHAIAAHFSQRADPAIITMPTGSGKTAVLCASPYLLRANRVLVLTPSRLVREQIVENFQTLQDLTSLGVLPAGTSFPKVIGAKHRVVSDAAWEDLRDSDVVVGTPHSLSPHIAAIPPPPRDLFDLVLADEAHHTPAETWKAILAHFSHARQILFTATPFRADRRSLPGRFAYTYELKAAYEDGVFGSLEYQPVHTAPGEDVDVAIARAAQEVFLTDRDAGLDHRVMVRTGQVARAYVLAALYAKETALRLEVITGDSGLTRVRSVLTRLNAGELDGIICVDMLGEGFNLPSLKIAALHSPHRSLGVILQFIGRFARTTGPRLGRATFLALPSEMAVESKKLFKEGAVWQEIVQNLSGTRIAEEQHTREVLSTFRETAPKVEDVPDLSLYSLRPFLHVKILNVGVDLDLAKDIPMPGGAEIVHRHLSAGHDTVVYVARETERPRWTAGSHLDSVRYELYILHLHAESGLLFVCASRREDDVYQHFAEQCGPSGGPALRGVSPVRLNRILNGLTEHQFYNVGMKSAAASNREMSYKTIVGSAVEQSVELADARGFYRGHWFGRATEDGRVITIGLSAGSKVWSNTGASISSLIDWCDHLGAKIADDTRPQTHSGLDRLSIGEEATTIPENVAFVDWPKRAYTHPEVVRYRTAAGAELQAQLLDVDIEIDPARTTESQVGLVFAADGFTSRATFSYATNRLVEAERDATVIRLEPGGPNSFWEYLNEHHPILYTSDLGTLDGFSYFRPPSTDGLVFDPSRIESRDWETLGVDRARETGPAVDGRMSIHGYFEADLRAQRSPVVFYDHGSGEMADFVTITPNDRDILLEMYHCKGAKGLPSSRVKDAYEVCGQAIKSHNWRDRRRTLSAIRSRLQSRGGRSRFIEGDIATAEALLTDQVRPVRLRVVIVQPGLARAALTPQVSALLAAVDEFVYGGRAERIRIIGSA